MRALDLNTAPEIGRRRGGVNGDARPRSAPGSKDGGDAWCIGCAVGDIDVVEHRGPHPGLSSDPLDPGCGRRVLELDDVFDVMYAASGRPGPPVTLLKARYSI